MITHPLQKRNLNIDLLKGSLILFVVIGHIAQGIMSESLFRTFIYSFHMPVFVGISGYLLNINSLKGAKVCELIVNYTNRLIIPWLLAVCFYAIVVNFGKDYNFAEYTLGIIKGILKPYYHLWYVPAYLCWVALSYLFVVKMKFSIRQILAISLCMYVCMYVCVCEQTFIVEYISRYARPELFIFFAFGMCMKEKEQIIKTNIVDWRYYILPILGLVMVIVNYYFNDLIIKNINNVILNISLLFLLLGLVIKQKLPHLFFLEWLGCNSYGIYLWHVVPILFVKYLCVNSIGTIRFYFYAVLSSICFMLFYHYSSRFAVIRQYLYGLKKYY